MFSFDATEWQYIYSTGCKKRKVWSFCCTYFVMMFRLCVMNNGTSTYFAPGRGVRQGDPPSAYLFLLGLEILLVAIRTNENIEGIIIIKENAWTALLSKENKPAHTWLRLVEHFAKLHAAQRQKNKAMWFVCLKKESSRNPLGNKWATEPNKGRRSILFVQ